MRPHQLFPRWRGGADWEGETLQKAKQFARSLCRIEVLLSSVVGFYKNFFSFILYIHLTVPDVCFNLVTECVNSLRTIIDVSYF